MRTARRRAEAMFSVQAKRFGLRLARMEGHASLQIPSALAKKVRKGTQATATRRGSIKGKYQQWKSCGWWAWMPSRGIDWTRGHIPRRTTARREAIMQHASPVVVVVSTGARKSVLFASPASVSSRVTIVMMVPLVALRGDMKARCEA
jgi:hypothetical protein